VLANVAAAPSAFDRPKSPSLTLWSESRKTERGSAESQQRRDRLTIFRFDIAMQNLLSSIRVEIYIVVPAIRGVAVLKCEEDLE
jgi:hypothetical protein